MSIQNSNVNAQNIKSQKKVDILTKNDLTGLLTSSNNQLSEELQAQVKEAIKADVKENPTNAANLLDLIYKKGQEFDYFLGSILADLTESEGSTNTALLLVDSLKMNAAQIQRSVLMAAAILQNKTLKKMAEQLLKDYNASLE